MQPAGQLGRRVTSARNSSSSIFSDRAEDKRQSSVAISRQRVRPRR